MSRSSSRFHVLFDAPRHGPDTPCAKQFTCHKIVVIVRVHCSSRVLDRSSRAMETEATLDGVQRRAAFARHPTGLRLRLMMPHASHEHRPFVATREQFVPSEGWGLWTQALPRGGDGGDQACGEDNEVIDPRPPAFRLEALRTDELIFGNVILEPQPPTKIR
jgi:hypothetical protein